ncbi:hypothetical protein WOC76_10395 [Methylocystis sp. IM3]|jgi:hypothetical protein|uniref:hypothetical protein n=1 Tax=unclassified Methylocystis TaxID=2625913 RepID=UPI000FBE7293|nr:MAG: hypothetical protein EKK29_10315 [Hyphomicrobiales bacterium]
MKKIALVPAALALSTVFALADGSSTPTPSLGQQFGLTQSIGDTSKGGFALNKGLFVQAQVPVNQGSSLSLSQKLDVSQTIGNTSEGGKAINKATVIQAQIPLSFSAP